MLTSLILREYFSVCSTSVPVPESEKLMWSVLG